MPTPLDDIDAILQEGIRASGQTSLGRRQPASRAIPQLTKARALLRTYVKQSPGDERAWRMLSLAEESLLGYGRALAAFERAVELSARNDKRDLKKLGALRTQVGEWANLKLTPQQLAELGKYIEGKLAMPVAQDSPLAWTEQWLRNTFGSSKDVQHILEALKVRGGTSDEDVLDNIVRGIAV